MCSVGHVHGVDFYRNPASASPGAWSALWCVAGTTIDHQELASGRLGCFRAFQAAANSFHQTVAVLPVELLVQAGQIANPLGLPATWWFLNANTPGDLRRAQILSQVLLKPNIA